MGMESVADTGRVFPAKKQTELVNVNLATLASDANTSAKGGPYRRAVSMANVLKRKMERVPVTPDQCWAIGAAARVRLAIPCSVERSATSHALPKLTSPAPATGRAPEEHVFARYLFVVLRVSSVGTLVEYAPAVASDQIAQKFVLVGSTTCATATEHATGGPSATERASAPQVLPARIVHPHAPVDPRRHVPTAASAIPQRSRVLAMGSFQGGSATFSAQGIPQQFVLTTVCAHGGR